MKLTNFRKCVYGKTHTYKLERERKSKLLISGVKKEEITTN
jgi:hypothetical protein